MLPNLPRWVVCLPSGRHIGLGLGFNLRLEFQGDLAQLPLVQVAAALLGIQRPLLGLQQIVKGEHRHVVGDAVFLTQALAVMPIHNDQLLIDDDRRVATILQQVRLQGGQLLPAQRGSSPASSASTVGVRSVLLVHDACVLH